MKSQPKKEVYWYTQKSPTSRKLDQDKETDVVVIGGGMAGLSAAQKLHEAGKKVMVIEADFCGAGASGKSSGFITPDSELQLADLLEDYGPDGAKKMRTFANGGIDLMRKNIEDHSIDCDYQIQDSLFVANSDNSFKKVKDEHDARTELGYKSKLYKKVSLPEVLGSRNYSGGVRYPGCFGINSYLYCQKMKEVLEKKGVLIYEKSPIVSLESQKVKTADFSVKAKEIVVATDRFLPDLWIETEKIYHVQTFLAVSKVLSKERIKALFPADACMVWDTDLIYQYYRIIEGNRLLFGAANIFYSYKPHENEDFSDVIGKMQRYLERKFNITDIEFEYAWPGMIGVTKDLVPIAGVDPKMKNVFFASGATGLPWAAALGAYLAEKIISGRDDYDWYFRTDRAFPVHKNIQKALGKPVTFAISHGIVKYFK